MFVLPIVSSPSPSTSFFLLVMCDLRPTSISCVLIVDHTYAAYTLAVLPAFRVPSCAWLLIRSFHRLVQTLPVPYHVSSWAVPFLAHTSDRTRAEAAASQWSEADEQNPGLLRDWNDELQAIRALPSDTPSAATLRARALYKFNCDFVTSASRGAQAVVLGNIPAMNPLDDLESQMFIWSNIFFSYASDSRGIFSSVRMAVSSVLSSSVLA